MTNKNLSMVRPSETKVKFQMKRKLGGRRLNNDFLGTTTTDHLNHRYRCWWHPRRGHAPSQHSFALSDVELGPSQGLFFCLHLLSRPYDCNRVVLWMLCESVSGGQEVAWCGWRRRPRPTMHFCLHVKCIGIWSFVVRRSRICKRGTVIAKTERFVGDYARFFPQWNFAES